MKRSKLYRLVPQKDLQRLDSAICNLMELAAKILGPEHARTRGRRRLPMEPYWWPEQETPLKPDTDLIELF
jgi:hypothetical protein